MILEMNWKLFLWNENKTEHGRWKMEVVSLKTATETETKN